jgi:RNA polymerase sigma factor (sigma-70 family)
MINSDWQHYYITNDQVLLLLKNFNESSKIDKNKIQEDIVNKLSYLVQSRIKGYKNKIYYIDLLQEGKIGLIKAIKDFDLERGPNFFKFALWHIKCRIRSYLKWQNKAGRLVSDDDNYFNRSSEKDLENNYEQAECYKIIIEEINKLPEIDRKILIMRFGINGGDYNTFKQIGEQFSLTKQRIEQIEKRALNILKKNKKINQVLGDLNV